MKSYAPLKSIYSFVAVAESGSMTAAAKQLSVSHSAISQAIKSLESQLGQALFQRSGRNVVLNTAGRKYYKQVAPALEQIVTATRQMQTDQNSQRITLNMSNPLALHWWIPQVTRFNQYAPELDVRISSLIGDFVMESEGVDVSIILGKKDDWQDYYAERLSHEELVLVCSPELYEKHPDVEALINANPAIMAFNDRRKSDWRLWCKANHLPIPKISRNLRFRASIQAVQATIRQLGVFVTPKLFVKDDIKIGLLVEVGESVLSPYQDYYFVCPPEKLKNEHILMLRAWIRSEFQTT